jgi:hypothetical protein
VPAGTPGDTIAAIAEQPATSTAIGAVYGAVDAVADQAARTAEGKQRVDRVEDMRVDQRVAVVVEWGVDVLDEVHIDLLSNVLDR